MIERFGLGPNNFVVEVASNDGYLLQYFVKRGVPVLGIEPASNVAKVAEEKGVPTLNRFFGTQLALELASQGKTADLIAGNNVLAQVPDLNDFVEGLKLLLKPHGILTLEFPSLLKLIELNEFDTIYHEHFSYFSLLSTINIMRAHGLKIFDVEELPTHGVPCASTPVVRKTRLTQLPSVKHSLSWKRSQDWILSPLMKTLPVK